MVSNLAIFNNDHQIVKLSQICFLPFITSNKAKKIIHICKLLIPGHWAGDVLGVTDSSKLPVLKECRWASSTVWYTIPVNWFVWNELKRKQYLNLRWTPYVLFPFLDTISKVS